MAAWPFDKLTTWRERVRRLTWRKPSGGIDVESLPFVGSRSRRKGHQRSRRSRPNDWGLSPPLLVRCARSGQPIEFLVAYRLRHRLRVRPGSLTRSARLSRGCNAGPVPPDLRTKPRSPRSAAVCFTCREHANTCRIPCPFPDTPFSSWAQRGKYFTMSLHSSEPRQ